MVVEEGVSAVLVGGVLGVAAGSAVAAGAGVGGGASLVGVGAGVTGVTGAAGVLGCGTSVAVAGNSLVSVVTCVTGAVAGLTTGGTITGAGAECTTTGGTSTVLALSLEWRRPARWMTAVTDATARGSGLVGWDVSRTMTGRAAAGLATAAAAVLRGAPR